MQLLLGADTHGKSLSVLASTQDKPSYRGALHTRRIPTSTLDYPDSSSAVQAALLFSNSPQREHVRRLTAGSIAAQIIYRRLHIQFLVHPLCIPNGWIPLCLIPISSPFTKQDTQQWSVLTVLWFSKSV